ncbi:MAG TPA: hypothetical protein VE155_06165 [Pseudonocardiaceae bacterium]|nr:hypothetical protein [Pseudonocardiaceae bacterium]
MRAALPRGLRTALLTAHITAAALWLGMDTALIAITAAHASIPAPLGAAMLTPSAATTLGTGFVLAAHRPWGLRRHHWIVAKVRISAVVAAAGLTSLSGILDDPLSVLAARVCALIALIAAIAVSVTKPWGLTQVGRAAAAKRSASGAGQRTYPRTTKVITSGGNRNPANAEATTEGGTQRAALINQSMTIAAPYPERNTASTRICGHITNHKTA